MEKSISCGVEIIHFTPKETRALLQQLYYGHFFLILPIEDSANIVEQPLNENIQIDTLWQSGVELMFQGIRVP